MLASRRFAAGRRPPSRWLVAALALAGLAIGAAAGASSCIATAPDLTHITDEDAGFHANDADTTTSAATGLPNTDPHAVIGTQPSHGPFTGGQRVLVRGNGFGSDVRVWFGGIEATEVVPVDATKVQVTAPGGDAGPVDVSAQNADDESTQRTLPGGYVYDALYAEPTTGPLSGGTEVHIFGQGTDWASGTQAFIDEAPCSALTVVSPTELVCTSPSGTAGSKAIRVTSASGTISVLDAFTYEDSTNGYKGGLSGLPLNGELRVLVYDNFLGAPVVGAHVVVGTDVSTAITRIVDSSGVVVIDDPSLVSPKTVTVAAHCLSPITFVDVPVDTVTVYLDPVLSPLCSAAGDPPGTGTKVGSTGIIKGELVFPTVGEFDKGPFTVPPPIGAEKQVAYVFASSSSPTAAFNLPSSTAAVTPTSPGTVGYGFTFYAGPGNRTLYALAGLEDDSKTPPTFVPYVMGAVKGVPVLPNEATNEVYIPMSNTLDEALTLSPTPPGVGPKGPDRLLSNVSIRLGNDGFASLPQGQKAPLLPLIGDVHFVGVPLLAGPLDGATYLTTAKAVSGPGFGAPMSVVSSVQSTSTAFPVVIDGFVGVPTLLTPALNTSWDSQHLETQFNAGGATIDLTVFDVNGMGGLMHWLVAVPKSSGPVTLPDISTFDDDVGLPPGPITVGIYGAHIDSFDYKTLRYGQLHPAGMTAYSLDLVSAHIP